MKKYIGYGPFIYATAIASFGLIQLVTQNFMTGLLPFSPTLPFRLLWVYLSSTLLLLAAAGIFFSIKPQKAAATAGALFFFFFLVLHVPKVLSNVHDGGEWAAAAEALSLGCGAFLIAPLLPNGVSAKPEWDRMMRTMNVISRYLLAVSLVIFGILHVQYFDYILTLIPSWIPAPVFWSCLVTAAFFLTALSLITRMKMSLATVLLGSMFLLWVLVLHFPRAISKLTIEPEWSSLFVALAFCGIAFSITFSTWQRE